MPQLSLTFFNFLLMKYIGLVYHVHPFFDRGRVISPPAALRHMVVALSHPAFSLGVGRGTRMTCSTVKSCLLFVWARFPFSDRGGKKKGKKKKERKTRKRKGKRGGGGGGRGRGGV